MPDRFQTQRSLHLDRVRIIYASTVIRSMNDSSLGKSSGEVIVPDRPRLTFVGLFSLNIGIC